MAKWQTTTHDDDLKTALIALGAVGLGIGAFLALSQWDKKNQFNNALKARLAELGVELISTELGKQDGHPFWTVTVYRSYTGAQTFRAAFEPGDDPYSVEVLGQLLRRLQRAMGI